MSKLIPSKLKNLFKSMRPPPANVVLQAAKAVTPATLKPHVPMIKFRKAGGSAVHSTSSFSTPPPQAAQAQASTQPQANRSPNKPNASTQLPHIEDWQLPLRYRRRPLDQQEIEYINRGGPE